jgi:hypothetical protein
MNLFNAPETRRLTNNAVRSHRAKEIVSDRIWPERFR